MRPRALVLRALKVGDLLTAVPALRGVRIALPDHEITLAAPAVLGPLVELVEDVDRLLPAAELQPVPWTGPPPQVAIDLHGRGPESRGLLAALQPGRLIGFDCPGTDYRGPVFDPDEHEVERWARLLRETLGVAVDSTDLGIEAPPVRPSTYGAVVIHPGASSGARRWPASHFGQVARWCCERGWPVVLTGGPQETELVDEVRRLSGLDPDADLSGRTGLAELASLVASARLVVSGDTGIAHLASAYGTASVVLFGPTPPSRWGPPQLPRHTVLWHPGPVGDPHAEDTHPGLGVISVDEVLDAVRQHLAKVRVLETTRES
ncbi:MAG: glycosyltransferase family 9 protein [Marmoricola sp.]